MDWFCDGEIHRKPPGVSYGGWYPMISYDIPWYPMESVDGEKKTHTTGCTPAKTSKGNDQEMVHKHEATCKFWNMSKLRFYTRFYNIYNHDNHDNHDNHGLIASDMITTNPKARCVCPNWAICSTDGHV